MTMNTLVLYEGFSIHIIHCHITFLLQTIRPQDIIFFVNAYISCDCHDGGVRREERREGAGTVGLPYSSISEVTKCLQYIS